MSTKTYSKKRKRDTTAPGEVVFKLSDPIPAASGPALVSYPAIQAPPSTAFQYYAQKKLKLDAKNEGRQHEKEVNEQKMLLVGETEDIEFVSDERESESAANSGCRYLIAVHNRNTSSLSILPMPQSPYILTRTVKRLKSIPTTVAAPIQYQEAKAALGEAFGTKKAKANLRAQARNRVDVSAMEGVVDHIQQRIEKGVVGLMTREEADETSDNNRLIPPFNATATEPSEVYPLHGIIPEVEWKALSTSAFKLANSAGRIALLPYKWSDWIKLHVVNMEEKLSKKSKNRLKIVFYVSAMLAFHKALQRSRQGIDKDDLPKKMPSVPGVITDNLLKRFTEVARDSSSFVLTPTMETSLFTHIFALCLKADEYATDTTVLAHDLELPVQKINQLFKSLGCKIQRLSDQERLRLGLPDASGMSNFAVLSTPVTFPKPKTVKRKTK